MQTLLWLTGLSLFLIGLFTGFAVPAMKNPRMGLASHVEAHMNGMFLILLGLLWAYVEIDGRWELIAVALLVYGAYANWFATLLAAIWGAGGGMMRIAAADHVGSGFKEGLIKFLLLSLSVADVVGVGIVIFGIVHHLQG
jgi:hydroxylaminobenzene mutase